MFNSLLIHTESDKDNDIFYIYTEHKTYFNYIKDNNATFQEYFLKFYSKPYDNYSSMTIDNCDFVIRHENIAEDYLLALKTAGVETPRPLPVANKTTGKKQDILRYYTDDIKERAIAVFGPFIEKNNYSFPNEWKGVKTPLKSKIQFWILGILRKINHKYFKKHSFILIQNLWRYTERPTKRVLTKYFSVKKKNHKYTY